MLYNPYFQLYIIAGRGHILSQTLKLEDSKKYFQLLHALG